MYYLNIEVAHMHARRTECMHRKHVFSSSQKKMPRYDAVSSLRAATLCKKIATKASLFLVQPSQDPGPLKAAKTTELK